MNKPLIMGIVNATPDSFSDGNSPELPLNKALRLLEEGADIIDFGGESTRPNAIIVSAEDELKRLHSVVKSFKKARPNAIVSIDTYKESVANVLLDEGVEIINDISGLQASKNMAETIAKYDAQVVIMHSKGAANNLGNYSDVVSEIEDFFIKQMSYAIEKGISKDKIILDVGLGFSKNMEENFQLLKATKKFSKIAPILVGHSRKRFIREYLQINDVLESDIGTLGVSFFAMLEGAKILRVHNVRINIEAINIFQKLMV